MSPPPPPPLPPQPLPDWLPQPPPAIVAIPAQQTTQRLRGKRVIIGEPGVGWRYDLRADNPVDRHGVTHVPVLPELDFYRAEIDHVEVFAPLVAVTNVWLEQPSEQPSEQPGKQVGQPAGSPDRLTTQPPTRYPVAAREAHRLAGQRVVLSDSAAIKRDLRAITDAHETAEGDIVVTLTAETEWYEWVLSGRTPAVTVAPIYLVWLE